MNKVLAQQVVVMEAVRNLKKQVYLLVEKMVSHAKISEPYFEAFKEFEGILDEVQEKAEAVWRMKVVLEEMAWVAAEMESTKGVVEEWMADIEEGVDSEIDVD